MLQPQFLTLVLTEKATQQLLTDKRSICKTNAVFINPKLEEQLSTENIQLWIFNFAINPSAFNFYVEVKLYSMSKKNIPLEVIDLNGNGFHVLVNVTVFKKPFKLVLDTGASKTAFDKTLLLELIHENELKNSGHLTTGLGTNDMQSFTTAITDLYVGKFHILSSEVAVLDLSAINIAYEKLAIEPVLGVLGGDILMEYHAVIDYEKCKLVLKS